MLQTLLSDPYTGALILGVLGNVLTDLVKFPLRYASNELDAQANLLRSRSSQTSKTVNKGIEDFTNKVDLNTVANFEEFILFLQSEEVAHIVRKTFDYNLSEEIGEDPKITIPSLRRQFIQEYHNFFDGTPEKLSNNDLEKFFNNLLDVAQDMFESEVASNNLIAHDALDKLRHLLEMNKLNEIQREIRRLKSEGAISAKKILEFEKSYRVQVAEVHGKITPPSFGNTRRVAIDQIYVTPNFHSKDPNLFRWNDDEIAPFDELVEYIDKTVVLGDPGAGKTTFTDKLCYELASRYDEMLVSGKRLTPIHITLRKYSEEKKRLNCSLAEYLEQSINSKYQIKPPTGAINYMLINGRAVVIFDGLDELLEVGHRREIVTDIEAFMRRYSLTKVLVTSREVGYWQAPLDEGNFWLYKILPFTKEQVNEYVEKWFFSDPTSSEEEKKTRMLAFLKESRNVPELRSNPLMLSLMCLLYKGEGYIPANRPDLYEKCSKMLFETWDRGRSIDSYKPFEYYFNNTLMNIAFWIYNQESEGREFELEDDFDDSEYDEHLYEDDDLTEDEPSTTAGVNEKAIIKIAADYLEEYFDNRHKAESYARELIDFCKNRAWVFTDVGEESYNFTHRTFLEYYTAQYLVRTYKTIDDLFKFLQPKIEKNEWFLVAQLALQIKNQSYESGADEIIELLIDKTATMSLSGKQQTQIFVCSCLEFINLRRKTREKIFLFVTELMQHDITQIKIGTFTKGNDHLRSIFGEVSKSNVVNMETINNLIEKFIKDLLIIGAENRKYAILFSADLPYLHDKESGKHNVRWNKLLLLIQNKLSNEDLLLLSSSDLETSLNCTATGLIPLRQAIFNYGATYLLTAAPLIYSRVKMPSVMSLLLELETNQNSSSKLRNLLIEIGESLSENPENFLIDKKNEHNYEFQVPPHYNQFEKTKISKALQNTTDSNLFMSIFWLYAMLFEFRGMGSLLVKKSQGTPLEKVLLHRINENLNEFEITILDKYQLNENQKKIIKDWIWKKFSFGV